VSGVRRQWTEKFDAPLNRGLTARPVVLAKTYEPGASRSRREVAIRAGRSMTGFATELSPEIQSSVSGDACGFGAVPAPGRGGLDPVASRGFRAVEGFVGCLDDFFRRWIFPPRSGHADACSHREFV
jgi:hypothetical protein